MRADRVILQKWSRPVQIRGKPSLCWCFWFGLELVPIQIVTFPHHCENRGAERPIFEWSVKFFVSTAKLADGSLKDIEQDSSVSWEVECGDRLNVVTSIQKSYS